LEELLVFGNGIGLSAAGRYLAEKIRREKGFVSYLY